MGPSSVWYFNHRKSIFWGTYFGNTLHLEDIRSAFDPFFPDCPFAHLMSGDAQTCFGAAHYALWAPGPTGCVMDSTKMCLGINPKPLNPKHHPSSLRKRWIRLKGKQGKKTWRAILLYCLPYGPKCDLCLRCNPNHKTCSNFFIIGGHITQHNFSSTVLGGVSKNKMPMFPSKCGHQFLSFSPWYPPDIRGRPGKN